MLKCFVVYLVCYSVGVLAESVGDQAADPGPAAAGGNSLQKEITSQGVGREDSSNEKAQELAKELEIDPSKYRHGQIVERENVKYRVEYRMPPEATDSHGHKPHEHASVVIVMLFGCMVVAQILLYFWKKYHSMTYQIVTLFGLWFIPMIISTKLLYWKMMIIWTIFSIKTFDVMRRAARKPLEKSVPRQVYGWFFLIYKSCYGMAIGGYIMFVLEFVGLFHVFNIHMLSYATLLMFYGLYFGVLGRDCAELCAERMASSMGYYGGKDGFPRSQIRPNVCAICDEQIQSAVRADRPIPSNAAEKIFTLSCQHKFHEFCIRGWTLIGKKETCPHCSEKVSLRKTFTNPWDNQSIAWAHVLDALRYLIVWNPVIIVVAQTSLLHMGYGPDDEMPTFQPILVPITGRMNTFSH